MRHEMLTQRALFCHRANIKRGTHFVTHVIPPLATDQRPKTVPYLEGRVVNNSLDQLFIITISDWLEDSCCKDSAKPCTEKASASKKSPAAARAVTVKTVQNWISQYTYDKELVWLKYDTTGRTNVAALKINNVLCAFVLRRVLLDVEILTQHL